MGFIPCNVVESDYFTGQGCREKRKEGVQSVPANGLPREIYGMRAISRGKGSLSELETQIMISKRLSYMDREEALLGRIETVRKLLLGLIRHLKKEST
ncbi:unnamed protein product [marine sediment metagenome]|uniref:Four helix bundle protein n=1 Tax=marine sediment metagenome TaxID=412755 RepID=X0U757_9ZZZZ